MRAYACPHCRALVFFANTRCLTCDTEFGYHPADGAMRELGPANPGCANRARIGCNWLVERAGEFCVSCALTRTRPADSDTDAIAAWIETEAAKRMLVAQLDTLGLPIGDDLGFDLLSSAGGPVTTGHADGLITLDLAEGDDAHREAVRVEFREPYRTVLGHLRHEIGHYYWPRLAENDPEFRRLFGDETRDYAEALAQNYNGPDDDSWRAEHVSRYAAAHPWEDWAETFAQYLHIREVLDTADAWGLRTTGPDLALDTAPLAAEPAAEPHGFDDLVATWLPLSYALNAINHSMGQHDLYPYLLSPPVLDKLRYVHNAVC
jgi:hypothetical protein